jgi:RNA recognition motif-containing protein
MSCKQETSNSCDQDTGGSIDGDFYPSTIFVGNLADTVDEGELQALFSRFGQIESIRIIGAKG